MDTESLNIERIHYYKDKKVVEDFIGCNFSNNLHLIWCKINLDHAVLAYLIDGCLEGEEQDIKVSTTPKSHCFTFNLIFFDS